MYHSQMLTKTDAQKLVSQMHSDGLDTISIPECFSSIDPDIRFKDCTYFDECKKVIIAKTITLITEYCFNETNVQSVIMIGVKYIGKYAFNSCENLETVDAPNVEYVKENAFSGCLKLKNIDFPRLIYAGSYAFFDIAVTEFKIPVGLKYIGFTAIYNDTTIVRIELGNAIPYIEPFRCVSFWIADADNKLYYTLDGSLYSKNKTILYSLHTDYYTKNDVALLESITTVSEYAFADIYVKKLTIPINVMRVCKNAFTYADIEELEIINPNIMLDQYAGIENSEIRRFSFPNKHSYLTTGNNYLIDRNKLIYISISDMGGNVYDFKDVAFFTDICCHSIHYFGVIDISLSLPNNVVSIEYWFLSNEHIVNIQLPDSIINIDYGAFDECKCSVEINDSYLYWSKDGNIYETGSESLPLNMEYNNNSQIQ